VVVDWGLVEGVGVELEVANTSLSLTQFNQRRDLWDLASSTTRMRMEIDLPTGITN
jgi:hypothetical protein